MSGPRGPIPGPVTYLDDGYRAGACNIGPEEIALRRRAGLIGVGAAVVLGAVLVALDAPAPARLLVGLPLYGGLVGIEQARRRFCVNFAARGIRNFGRRGEASPIGEASALAADRRAAARMIAEVGLVSAVVAVAFALVPLGAR